MTTTMTTTGHGQPARTLARYAADLAAQGYSEQTVRAKTLPPALAAAWAGVDPAQLTREHVLGWLGSKPRAVNTRIKYLEWVRAWCAFAGIDDATAGVRRPRTPTGIPKPVAEVDLQLMLAAASSPRLRAWLVLGAYCGLRAHESAKVALEDLEATAGGDPVLRVFGKGGRVALVPCAPVVVDALRAAAGDAAVTSGRIWPDATSQSVQGAVRRAAARAGVVCTSHQLRHRYGTAVYAAGHDLLLTQQLMRHASPATTAGYAQVAAGAGLVMVQRLPGAGRLPEPGERPRLRLVPPLTG